MTVDCFSFSDQLVASNKEVVLNDLWLALLHLGNVTLICRIFATSINYCILGLAIKSLNTKQIGGGDNGCGSGLLGVQQISYIPQT